MTEPSPTQYIPPEEPQRSAAESSASPPQPVGSTGSQTSGMAIAALVLGICGIVLCPVVLSVPAIVFGAIAMRDINRDPGLDGKGMAIAGFVTGIVGTALGVILIIILIALGVAAENESNDNDKYWAPGPGREYNLD